MTAPRRVVEIARRVMGAIDLDAYGDADLSPMIGARAFHPRDAVPQELRPAGKGRVLLAMASGGMPQCRQLSQALLRAWEAGEASEALLWTSRNELMRQSPWIFDAPLMVCLPFHRLTPQYLDDEINVLRQVERLNTWSFMVYFPRMDDLPASRARFFGAAGGLGRIIEARDSPVSWEDGYRHLVGKDYWEGR